MRKFRVSNINANILRATFFFARCLGLVFFRFKNSKDNVLVFEESGWNRKWWKWITVILRLVPLCGAIYIFTLLIRKDEKLDQLIQTSQLVVTIQSYLSMIHLHFFHGPELIKLVNRYLNLFRQLRSLTMRKKIGFGGGQELLLITIFFVYQFQEFVYLSIILPLAIGAENIVFSACLSYTAFASNMVLRISFVWYLNLGVLFAEVQECMCFELQSQIVKTKSIHRRLKRIMKIFIEIIDVVSSLQGIINVYLFLNLFHKLFYIVVISNDMITFLHFWKFEQWFRLIKVTIEILAVVLAIQESINQFRYIQELTLDLFLAAEMKDWNKTVEIFVTHLNLKKFRVRLLDMFDISNEFFLITVSGIVNYIIFIVQFVMQRRNMQL